MPQRTRLKDIADALGLHKSTVSMALRGDPRIASKTRVAICEKAREMGYTRDASLEILSSYRWSDEARRPSANITLIHPEKEGELTRKLSEMLSSARERASQLGFSVSALYLSDYERMETAARVLLHRGTRGLIISPGNAQKDWTRFPWEHFCAVTVQGGFGVPDLHTVRENHFTDFIEVYKRLRASGYRRIGLMPQYTPWSMTDERRVAAAYFVNEYMVPKQDRVPILALPYLQYEPIIPWIREHRIEAVLTCSAAIYYLFEEHGLRMPEDIGLAILEVEKQEIGHIAGMGLGYHTLGARAIDMIIDMMRRNDFGLPKAQEILAIRADWLPGSSIRDAADS